MFFFMNLMVVNLSIHTELDVERTASGDEQVISSSTILYVLVCLFVLFPGSSELNRKHELLSRVFVRPLALLPLTEQVLP